MADVDFDTSLVERVVAAPGSSEVEIVGTPPATDLDFTNEVEGPKPDVLDATPELALALTPPATPNTLPASPKSVHPTTTPVVVFIGMAKHRVPAGHTVLITKLPAALHFPTFPEMQATSPLAHGDEKFSVEKRLLYPCASARFDAKTDEETEDVDAAGAEEMMVGIWVIDSAVTEMEGALSVGTRDVEVVVFLASVVVDDEGD